MSLLLKVFLGLIILGSVFILIDKTWDFLEHFYAQKRSADLFLNFNDFEKYFYLKPKEYKLTSNHCIFRESTTRFEAYSNGLHGYRYGQTYFIGFKKYRDYSLAIKLINNYKKDKEAFEKQQKQKEYLRNYLEIVQEDINELRKEAKEETDKAKKLLDREKQMEEHRKEMFEKLLNQPLDENIIEKYLNNYFDEYK